MVHLQHCGDSEIDVADLVDTVAVSEGHAVDLVDTFVGEAAEKQVGNLVGDSPPPFLPPSLAALASCSPPSSSVSALHDPSPPSRPHLSSHSQAVPGLQEGADGKSAIQRTARAGLIFGDFRQGCRPATV